MFAGHYATALAAKAIEPRAPLWTLIAGAQLVDIGWSVLVIAGVERGHIDVALLITREGEAAARFVPGVLEEAVVADLLDALCLLKNTHGASFASRDTVTRD